MRVHPEFNLGPELWYRIGGKVKYFIEAADKADIKEIFLFLKKAKVKKFFFLGSGSNLIFTDDYYDGAVIKFLPGPDPIKLVKPHIIEADAGVILDDVIKFAFDNNLVGLEWAGGLPGNVGAAIRGNVGAFGGEIKDTLKDADVFEVVNGRPKFYTLKNYQLKFSYRDSIVKKKKLGVLKARFRLKIGDEEAMHWAKQTYKNNVEYRKLRHPLEYPNCGSVFKNISEKEHVSSILEILPDIEDKVKRDWHGKVSMGYLIKRLDLSGYRVGDAMVSPKHCNFIVNLGNAKSSDALSVVSKIQDKFQETFEFTPEVEVETVK